MKVVLFSSYYPGEVNKLNISLLIQAYPDYDYTYVLVDNRMKYFKNNIKNWLKEIVLTLLFKKTDWYRARRLIEKKIAREIPLKSLKKFKRILVKGVNDSETEKIIKNLSPDLILQCGAGILKENIFSIARIGTLNVHHGIAPELRGVSSAFWAMYYGLKEYIGITVHFINKTLDTGLVIIQEKTNLPKQFDYVEASFQTAMQGAPLLVKAIQVINTAKYFVIETEVKSFYFSSVNYKKYWELKKNNFETVGNPEKLVVKIKKKKQIKID